MSGNSNELSGLVKVSYQLSALWALNSAIGKLDSRLARIGSHTLAFIGLSATFGDSPMNSAALYALVLSGREITNWSSASWLRRGLIPCGLAASVLCHIATLPSSRIERIKE